MAAQRWVDDLNAAHDAFVEDVVGPILDENLNAPQIVKARADKLDAELLKISEQHAAAIIKRYDIAKWYTAKRNPTCNRRLRH